MGQNVKKICHPVFSTCSVGYKYFVLSDQLTTTLIFKTWLISVYFCDIKYCCFYGKKNTATASGHVRWRINIFSVGNIRIDLCYWWHSYVVRNSTQGISPAPNPGGNDTTLLVRFSVIWSKQGNNLPFDVRYNCIATTLQNVWTSIQLFKLFEELCGKERERIPCLLPEIQLNLIKYSYNSTHLSRQLVTRTIHQTEIPTLLDSLVTNTSSVKISCPQKIVSTDNCIKT